MTETTLFFYITEHCELCTQAEAVLVATPIEDPIPVEVVDIAESEELVEQYGTRIPVLRREPDGAELNWPFTQEDVVRFVVNP
ncbi:MAG: glutaredoxin family protein [Halomonadaceae bacterium]|nr:MAG: glutaredoxin family protein [Halomonadaceae bacterium]